MSQSQVASAVEVHKFSMSRFLDEKQLGGKSGKGYRGHKIDFDSVTGNRGGNGKINIIPIDLATEFWLEQAMKGNVKAQGLTKACLEEALKRMCDKAFEQLKTEEEYEKATGINYQTWIESRWYYC